MKFRYKKAICVIMTIITVFCSFSFLINASEEKPGFTDEDFLVTKGQDIVNRRGEKIQLKGVNLGAWLIWEDWLCPYEEATDHYDVLTKLTERFGQEKAYELMDIYMDNWITEYDLDEIKAMGFNCVRVPFWFRNFYYDDNGTKILDENGEWDFSRLEWVVNECSKREIYVVLDMHGAVGYQSDAPHNGKADSCGLYAKSEKGGKIRNKSFGVRSYVGFHQISDYAVDHFGNNLFFACRFDLKPASEPDEHNRKDSEYKPCPNHRVRDLKSEYRKAARYFWN